MLWSQALTRPIRNALLRGKASGRLLGATLTFGPTGYALDLYEVVEGQGTASKGHRPCKDLEEACEIMRVFQEDPDPVVGE